MHYRKVGSSGLKVSVIGVGAWLPKFGTVQDEAYLTRLVARALEGGVNFFDNADAYKKGEAERTMRQVFKAVGVPRHQLVLSTKVFGKMSDNVNDRGLSRKHVLESIDLSLERMGTGYVDLYFAHQYDPDTPLEESVEAFSAVVRSGKAHYWGTSNWPAAQVAAAHAFANGNGLVPPVVEQPQYSMLHREQVERDLLPVLEQTGMGLVPWSPLAMGMLTGKYDAGIPQGSRFEDPEYARRYLSEPNRAKVRALKSVADELGVSRAQLALAWLLRRQAVSSVITSATKLEQLESNLEAAGIRLDPECCVRIEDALRA